jgi:sec-independent protein translocase protein TatB
MLIGIVALIFLGPRKLPVMARKIGKILAEFRSTTNEFRSTWEREVDFSEEASAFQIDDDIERPVERTPAAVEKGETSSIEGPTIKEIDSSSFTTDVLKPKEKAADTHDGEADVNDRKNWL